MNNRNQQIAPAISGDTYRDRQRRDRVVHANNDDSRVEIALIILAVLFLCSIVLGVAGGRLAGLGYAWQALLSVLPMLPLSIWAIPFITGHAPAFFEAWQGEKTERKWADVESEKIEATRTVAVMESLARIELQRHSHAETMLRIETDQRLQLGYINAGRAEPVPDNFTPAVPTPANVAVRAFIDGCYDDKGFTWPGNVNGASGMLTRNPWAHQWRGEPWADDARLLMEKHLLSPAGNGNQWKMKHPTKGEAHAALPRLPV